MLDFATIAAPLADSAKSCGMAPSDGSRSSARRHPFDRRAHSRRHARACVRLVDAAVESQRHDADRCRLEEGRETALARLERSWPPCAAVMSTITPASTTSPVAPSVTKAAVSETHTTRPSRASMRYSTVDGTSATRARAFLPRSMRSRSSGARNTYPQVRRRWPGIAGIAEHVLDLRAHVDRRRTERVVLHEIHVGDDHRDVLDHRLEASFAVAARRFPGTPLFPACRHAASSIRCHVGRPCRTRLRCIGAPAACA